MMIRLGQACLGGLLPAVAKAAMARGWPCGLQNCRSQGCQQNHVAVAATSLWRGSTRRGGGRGQTVAAYRACPPRCLRFPLVGACCRGAGCGAPGLHAATCTTHACPGSPSTSRLVLHVRGRLAGIAAAALLGTVWALAPPRRVRVRRMPFRESLSRPTIHLGTRQTCQLSAVRAFTQSRAGSAG